MSLLRFSILTALLLPAGAMADDGTVAQSQELAFARVGICYNYGCLVHAVVDFTPWQLGTLKRMLAGSASAAEERKTLGRVIGRMFYFAGASTPIWRDHGMNYRDGGVDGMMDCVDHSHNTSEFLQLLQQRGLLRFHRVLGRLKRNSYMVAEHWSARIADKQNGVEYAVDSWYLDPGEPAAVMPVADWFSRKDPRG